MLPILTDAQVEKARALRAEGKTYPEIANKIGFGGPFGTIRGRCLDIDAPRKAASTKAVKERGDGKGTIRAYAGIEDATIKLWVAEHGVDPSQWPRGSQSALAAKLDNRKPHSVVARIKTLQRQGAFEGD